MAAAASAKVLESRAAAVLLHSPRVLDWPPPVPTGGDGWVNPVLRFAGVAAGHAPALLHRLRQRSIGALKPRRGGEEEEAPAAALPPPPVECGGAAACDVCRFGGGPGERISAEIDALEAELNAAAAAAAGGGGGGGGGNGAAAAAAVVRESKLATNRGRKKGRKAESAGTADGGAGKDGAPTKRCKAD